MSGQGDGRDRQERVGGVDGEGGSGSNPKRRRIGFSADVEMEEAEENDDPVELRLRVRQVRYERAKRHAGTRMPRVILLTRNSVFLCRVLHHQSDNQQTSPKE